MLETLQLTGIRKDISSVDREWSPKLTRRTAIIAVILLSDLCKVPHITPYMIKEMLTETPQTALLQNGTQENHTQQIVFQGKTS